MFERGNGGTKEDFAISPLGKTPLYAGFAYKMLMSALFYIDADSSSAAGLKAGRQRPSFCIRTFYTKWRYKRNWNQNMIMCNRKDCTE